MKKVAFVTGANGFVGSHLVELLIDKGMEVHCLMRKSSNDKWLKNLDITIHRGGIEDSAYLREVFEKHQANYIYHLAGTVKAFDYAGFEAGNVNPTKCILDACTGIKSIDKIIVTSSIAASRATTVGHPNSETCERKPLTDYGMSKVAEEDLAISYMDRLPIAIIRPPVVYGERDSEVLLFFKTIKMHLIPLIGFSPKAVSIVHAKDLVRGFYLCSVSDKSAGQTYFVGGHRDEYSWGELGEQARTALDTFAMQLSIPHLIIYGAAFIYESIAKIGGLATTFNSQKAREMVSEAWTCSSGKALKDFGYQAEISIETGFKKTIAWYRKEGWL